jgi:hypothetical protein
MPSILHKDWVGTNELSAATGLTISNYAHPGGALTVFGYHGGDPSSGYTVTFDGEPIAVLQNATGLGNIDDQPNTFLAHADDVPATTADLVISWAASRSRPSCHVFSVDGEYHAHALNRQTNTTALSAAVDSFAGGLAICYVGWRDSAENISARGSGQTSELSDDSPTRQGSDSKAAAAGTTDFGFTMSATSDAGAYNLHAISYVEPGGPTPIEVTVTVDPDDLPETLTGWRWALFGSPLVDQWLAPLAQGADGEWTAGGEFVVDVTGVMGAQETGYLYITNSDGTISPHLHHGRPVEAQEVVE